MLTNTLGHENCMLLVEVTVTNRIGMKTLNKKPGLISAFLFALPLDAGGFMFDPDGSGDLCIKSLQERGKTMCKSISVTVFLVLSSLSLNAIGATTKETICHNYGQISVAQPAVQAHLNHGDVLGSCPPRPPSTNPPSTNPDPDPETTALVVMMRCEAQGDDVVVVSFSASFDFASIAPVEPAACPEALANLLDRGLTLRSVTWRVWTRCRLSWCGSRIGHPSGWTPSCARI